MMEQGGQIPGALAAILREAAAAMENATAALVAGVGETLDKPAGKLDLDRIETRAAYISAMKRFHATITRLTGRIAKFGAAAEETHRAEVAAVQTRIARASGQPPAATAPVVVAAKKPTEPETKNATPAARGPAAPRQIQRAALATLPGAEVCLVPEWGQRFAFKVGGVLFHAGLGRIYASRRGRGRGAFPEKSRSLSTVKKEGESNAGDSIDFVKQVERVNSCRRGAACGARCSFYHDPATCPGSRDVRNFTLAICDVAERVRQGTPPPTPEEASQLCDFAAHLVLCALLARQRVAH